MSKDTSMAEGTPEEQENIDEVVVDDALSSDGETVDLTPPLDPEDFDFNAFVEGVRPGRRAVKITMRADLMAEVDQIIANFGEGAEERTEEEAKAALARFKEIKAKIIDSQRWFVVEARADSRIEEIIDTMRKSGKPRPNKKATPEMVQAWNEELLLRRLADAIVTPSNVTYEGLVKLRAVGEAQVNLLAGAMQMVNSNPTDGVKGLTPDFSQGL